MEYRFKEKAIHKEDAAAYPIAVCTILPGESNTTMLFDSEELSTSPLKFPEWLPWLSHAAFFV